VLWPGIVVSTSGAVTPQVRETRNSMHLVNSHDWTEHCVLVLPDEVSRASGGHVALMIRLAVHTEPKHYLRGQQHRECTALRCIDCAVGVSKGSWMEVAVSNIFFGGISDTSWEQSWRSPVQVVAGYRCIPGVNARLIVKNLWFGLAFAHWACCARFQ
jgi:hypothetical protein